MKTLCCHVTWLSLLWLVAASISVAAQFTVEDVQLALRDQATVAGLGGDIEFVILTLDLPKNATDVGSVCGALENTSTSQPFSSFLAALKITAGELTASTITALYAKPLCRTTGEKP